MCRIAENRAKDGGGWGVESSAGLSGASSQQRKKIAMSCWSWKSSTWDVGVTALVQSVRGEEQGMRTTCLRE